MIIYNLRKIWIALKQWRGLTVTESQTKTHLYIYIYISKYEMKKPRSVRTRPNRPGAGRPRIYTQEEISKKNRTSKRILC